MTPTIEDLQIIMNVQEFLHGNADTQMCEKYDAFVERVATNKQKANAKAAKFNKDNKEWHNISNKLWYAKKTGNQTKIELYTKQLEDIKKTRNHN